MFYCGIEGNLHDEHFGWRNQSESFIATKLEIMILMLEERPQEEASASNLTPSADTLFE